MSETRSPILNYAAHNPITAYISPDDEDTGGIALLTELGTNLLTELDENILTD